MNAGLFLWKSALHRPDAPAIRYGETALTYGELGERCRRLAAALAELGLRPGDRVAVLQANRPELIEAVHGTLMAGMVVVPINVRLHALEVAHILADSGARVLIADGPLADALDDVPPIPGLEHRVAVGDGRGDGYEALVASARPVHRPSGVAPGDVAWLFYTSGTTGRPKGAIWTHRTVAVTVMNYLADVYCAQPEDVYLHAAPLSHGSGVVSLSAIAKGAANVILDTPSFDTGAFFDLIAGHRVTNVAFLAPTQIVKLLADFDPARHDLSSLRCVCYGGAPMFVEDVRRSLEAFGPILAQIYGQGEAPMTISYLRPRDHDRFWRSGDRRLASVGIPRTDVEVAVADADDTLLPPGEVGEILVRGEVVMPGYWNQPDATAQTLRNGWLHTGDVGRLDENGFLYIVNRSKDMIISGGNNIYPSEVEQAILELPAVEEAAVVGVPDPYWGESVHAVVVLRPGARVTAGEIVAQCTRSLASYKKPKSIEFARALPKNAYGKVLKTELRRRVWDDHGGSLAEERDSATT